jgi:hypothetical protein
MGNASFTYIPYLAQPIPLIPHECPAHVDFILLIFYYTTTIHTPQVVTTLFKMPLYVSSYYALKMGCFVDDEIINILLE